jgi:hypothetical protein
MAMSVDGFKKQSPPHADEIAFATYSVLSKNPAEQIGSDVEVTEPPHGILGEFFKWLPRLKKKTPETPKPA